MLDDTNTAAKHQTADLGTDSNADAKATSELADVPEARSLRTRNAVDYADLAKAPSTPTSPRRNLPSALNFTSTSSGTTFALSWKKSVSWSSV